MVEAATYWPLTALFMSGFPALSADSTSQSSCEMPPTNTSGLKSGALAMARTSPFVASRTMAAPDVHSFTPES